MPQQILTWIEKYHQQLVVLFFAAYFILGMLVVNDYGISWDEPTERFTSHRQYKFAVSKLFYLFGYESPLLGEHMFNRQMLHGNQDRYYGTFLHWPLVALEHTTGFTLDSREVYLSRHINTFLYYFLAVVCLYLLVKKRFNSWRAGLLAAGLLIVTPRFFAESFYNNKDILFAACYIIGIFFSLWFLEKITWWRALITGIVLGLAINTRIMAGLLLILIIGWGVVNVIAQHKKLSRKLLSQLAMTVSVMVLAGATYIITMPTAWGNELGFLPEVFQQFSRFDWQGKTLYLGRFAAWNDIPWHFIPVYLWATTPLWYSLLFVIGVITLAIKTVRLLPEKKFWASKVWRYDLFVLASLLVPLLAVILLRSVVYNSWRHLYFIYGPFVYLMILGMVYWQRLRKLLLAGIVITMTITIFWMVKNHPYQFLYFNPMARINAADNFERDYWGLITLDLLEYMLTHDRRPTIKIYQQDFAHKAIELMLNKSDKARFQLVENQLDADYATHWFYNTQDKSWTEPSFELIKVVEVDGTWAQALYKRVDK